MNALDLNSKIKTHHLDRLAVVYVRQSTPSQLVKHKVSRERQVSLRQVAVSYGWAEESVIVVESDQGKSAAWGSEREGFAYLMDEVCGGNVGAILCLEASRLSREDSEFSHLVRLCMWTKTLLCDERNVYDPNIPEDRLVLNVKGISSSLELDFIIDRMQGARRLLMSQGKYRFCQPTGYVYDDAKNVVMDTREGVQESIRLFFDTFEGLGSAMAVVRYFKDNDILFPTKLREGERKGEIVWKHLTYYRAAALLHNPAYAGTYAAGRSEWRVKVTPGQPYRTKKGLVILGRPEWKYVLHDAFPAYISWTQFLRNEQVLKSNRNHPGEDKRGAPRSGVGLLQGLAFCGRCNVRMYMSYPKSYKYQFYVCCLHSNLFGARHCQSFRGKYVDEAVEELFLQAFEPARLELAVRVHNEVSHRQTDINAREKTRIKQAEADLKKIEGRYDFAADNNDSRMARRLAKEYDEKKAEVGRLKREQDESLRLQPPPLSEEDCRAIMGLNHGLIDIWHSAATTQEDRKYLLRLAIDRVVLTRDNYVVHAVVHWRSGARSALEVKLPPPAYDLKTAAQIIELIRTLGVDHTNQEIADHLNQAGYKNKRGGQFSAKRVRVLRYRYRFIAELDGEVVDTGEKLYSMAAAARLLVINKKTVSLWSKKGILESVQEEPGGPWLIKLDPSKIRELRAKIDVNKNIIHSNRPEELRRTVVRAYDNGEGSYRELAKKYGVSVSFISKARKTHRETGSLAYKPRNRQPAVGKEAEQLIRRTLKKQPGIKLAALQAVIKEKLGLSFTRAVLYRTLTRYGFPRSQPPPKPVYAIKRAS